MKTILVLMIALLFYLSCSDNQPTAQGGSATDVGNAMVAGKIVASNSNPAARARVRLFPSDYNPYHDDRPVTVDMTNDSGCFVFTNIKSGTYNILADDSIDLTKLLIRKLLVNADDSLILPPDTLKQTGKLIITLFDSLIADNNYVYLPGTDRYLETGSLDTVVTLDSVPGSMVSVILKNKSHPSLNIVVVDSIEVIAGGSTVAVPFPLWKHHTALTLNTREAGADVAESITQFPVLVRLDSTSFPFSEAQATGADIRFTNQYGNSLAYEIESYDFSGKTAFIWVQVDTVLGNSETRLRMYWGNPAAGNESSSAAVFDTALGFRGVWHLNNQSHDATQNRNNGTMSSGAYVQSNMGAAFSYMDSGDCIVVPNPSNQSLSFGSESFFFSAWIKVFQNNGDLDKILWKEAYGIKSYYGTLMAVINNGGIESDFGAENEFYLNDQWIYLACVIDKNNNFMKTFTNGSIVDSTDISGVNAFSTTFPLMINESVKTFEGIIDEVRIQKGSFSSTYIKLCFENQKQNQTLVHVE